MEIEVIPMELSHINKLVELERICFSTPWTYDSFFSELNNTSAKFRVATVDSEVAGYIGIHCIPPEGFVTNVAVFPNFRGNHIAQRLISYALSMVDVLMLEVRESNTAAIHLYEKLGFERVGLRKDFYTKPKENAILYNSQPWAGGM